ncbi:MAG: (d)CMP kinase [Gemmatimonadetes bacterium]|nr:(d)CMP kinase [Gemmatimonadota bacterium]
MRRRPVVAIDGPAASGKSSTARAVAEALGFCHLDSGSLYRALTLTALRHLGPPERWTADGIVAEARRQGVAVAAAGRVLEVTIAGKGAGDAIRGDDVTREVSRVAALGPVRTFVNALLRAAAADGGVVMDGRDIGTAVFPDAEVKVFLAADPAERARRRLAEKGRPLDEAGLLAEAGELAARDRHDSSREVAPLTRAPDATLLDTTRLTLGEQVRAVVELVRRVSGVA